MKNIDIIEVESGICTLEEDGINVFLADCQKFGIQKHERKKLMIYLREVVAAFRSEDELEPLLRLGVVKQLTRQENATEVNLWEVREDGGGARILFIKSDPDAIVVAAVHKSKGSLSQAVNRGVNRWKMFLKKEKK